MKSSLVPKPAIKSIVSQYPIKWLGYVLSQGNYICICRVFICFGRLNMEICDWKLWFSQLIIEFVKWGSHGKSLVGCFIVFCLALFRSLFKIYRKKHKLLVTTTRNIRSWIYLIIFWNSKPYIQYGCIGKATSWKFKFYNLQYLTF